MTCQNCFNKDKKGKCPYSNSLECDTYIEAITEYCLLTSAPRILAKIPAKVLASGLQAQGYSGEVRKTKVVII